MGENNNRGYYTPNGRMIDGVGLEPTFMLKMNRRENIKSLKVWKNFAR